MKTLLINIRDNRFSFYVLASGVLLSAAFYIYCVNMAVRNTISRNGMESKISSLQANLSDLETAYVVKVSSLTLDSAKTLGLHEPKNKIFISKNSSTKSLSYNKGF